MYVIRHFRYCIKKYENFYKNLNKIQNLKTLSTLDSKAMAIHIFEEKIIPLADKEVYQLTKTYY